MSVLTAKEKMELLETGLEHIQEALEFLAPLAKEDPNFQNYIYNKLENMVSGVHNPYDLNLNQMLDTLAAAD